MKLSGITGALLVASMSIATPAHANSEYITEEWNPNKFCPQIPRILETKASGRYRREVGNCISRSLSAEELSAESVAEIADQYNELINASTDEEFARLYDDFAKMWHDKVLTVRADPHGYDDIPVGPNTIILQEIQKSIKEGDLSIRRNRIKEQKEASDRQQSERNGQRRREEAERIRPFALNPQSFNNAINRANWNGQSIRFTQLGNCVNYGTSYVCTSGYVRISNPVETKTCYIRNVSWYAYNNSFNYTTGRCQFTR